MRLELKPYPEYKNSSESWLGHVPVHWRLLRLKYLSSIRTGDRDTVDREEFGQYPFFVRSQKVERINSHSYDGEAVLTAGDGYIGKVFHYINGKFDYHQRVYKFSDFRFVSGMFFYYYLRANLQKELQKHSAKSTVDSVRLPMLQNLIVSIPPLDEQSHLVSVISGFEARIKRLIRNKRRLIGLLREQKQAIINQAVTRGIAPNVPLKPSGIPWLGDIPVHWDVVRCKYLFREIDVRSTTGLETHLSMSQKFGLVPNSMLNERRLISESYVGAKTCKTDDLVLNRLKAHLGIFARATQDGLVSPDYTVFRPKTEMDIRYFESLLRTPTYITELRKRTKGIVEGFWRLYSDDFFDIPVPRPPVVEQESLLNWLNQETRTIQEAISRSEREIELINEYCIRLISDVVTGKVDVRDVVINEDELEAVGSDALDTVEDDEDMVALEDEEAED